MKSFSSKVKPKKGASKKANARTTDGRANPAVLAHVKYDTFAAGIKVRTLPKKIAEQVTSTPMRHQSGKGTRGVRESLNGDSKTACIRYLAAMGFDRDNARRAIAELFDMMTPGVFSKHWGYGELLSKAEANDLLCAESKAVLAKYK